MLFCDLVGSTELSAQLDPEELREVIGAYHHCTAAVVERFEGHIAKYLGDGVLAYFGYPRAHEDDAERAVRAGLAMVEAVAGLAPLPDVQLEARIGIATGMAVVGDLIGEGLHAGLAAIRAADMQMEIPMYICLLAGMCTKAGQPIEALELLAQALEHIPIAWNCGL